VGQAIVTSIQKSGPTVLQRMAWFRYELRKFLRFSENASRAAGITPQQHQLLLGIAGFTGRGWATISELAEFLQERHNAVVMLVERAVVRGLVHKSQGTSDRRFIRVTMTAQGEAILKRIARLNQAELRRVKRELIAACRAEPKVIRQSDVA
jgi:DNA-binding MarR family transcriptional regulator